MLDKNIKNDDEQLVQLRAIGKWRVPELFGENEVHGELCFGGNKFAKLEVYFDYAELRDGIDLFSLIRIPTIIGFGTCKKDAKEENLHLVLFECMVQSSTNPLNIFFNGRQLMKIVIGVSDVWAGSNPIQDLPMDKNDWRLHSYSFSLNGLEDWCGGVPFDVSPKDAGAGVTINYKRPESILVYEDDKVKVFISYDWRSSGMGIRQTSATITHAARIYITCKTELELLPYYGDEGSFSYYERFLTYFFGILIGGGAYDYARKGWLSTVANEGWSLFVAKSKPINTAKNMYRAPWTVFRLINGKLPKITQKYFGAYDKCEDDLYTLYASINAHQQVDMKSLAELLFAFEGLFAPSLSLEGDKYLRDHKGSQEARQLLDNVLEKCSKEECAFLKEKIQILLTYAMKLRVATEVARREFPCLQWDSEEFWTNLIQHLRNSRNLTAHSLERGAFDAECYMASIEFVQCALIWMILRRCGLVQDEIAHVLQYDHNCDHSLNVLRNRMNATKKGPIFSIVVPACNVGQYIKECCDSIAVQSYKSWEAICIDDGSTDGTAAILDQYANTDDRFKVFHQKNKGVAKSRNRALSEAKGEWILFVDSDDVLLPGALNTLSKRLAADVDAILMKHVAFKDALPPVAEQERRDQKLATAKIEWNEYFHPVFAAAFRREAVKDLRFEPLTIGEDRVWYLEALDRAKKRVWLDYVGYGYREREGSAIHSKMTRRKFGDNLKHFEKVCEIVGRRPKRYAPAVLRRIGQSLTEYTGMEFVALEQADKATCHKFWLEILGRVKHYPWLTPFQRFVMNVCVTLKSRLVTTALCYGPYWLKAHGLHR